MRAGAWDARRGELENEKGASEGALELQIDLHRPKRPNPRYL
ncbi:MAG: hypothetical protein WAN62_08810 [Candidatus Acidiferrum sp.]